MIYKDFNNILETDDTKKTKIKDTRSRSWFCVFDNPQDHGYEGTPQEVCERLRDEWISKGDSRTGAWLYCISKDGLPHIHMVLENSNAIRFSTVKKYCPSMHIEVTMGNKQHVEDYVNKRGKWEEKGETVEYKVVYGDIQGKQGQRATLEDYYNRMKSGETPNDILRDSPKAYCHLSVLKNMYYDIRSDSTPIVRDLKVYWHLGATGSGKSYERVNLAKEKGEENIFYLSVFNSGAFDKYNGEPIIWIEDYRSEFKLQELLRYLDVYKAELPARFTNGKALWNEVHITSVLTPSECYPKATLEDNDRIEQLLRRITSIVYHYKNCHGNYYKLYFSPFMTRNQMFESMVQHKKFTEQFACMAEDAETIITEEQFDEYIKTKNKHPEEDALLGVPRGDEEDTNK